MLPKNKRLNTAAFNKFFKTGRRFHTPYLTICFTPYTTFHASVVVGKKVNKNAVERNRIRRQLYSLLYSWQKKETVKGVFIVFTKPSAKDVSFKTLKNDLESVLIKIESGVNPG